MAERYHTPSTQLETIINKINKTFDNLILQVNKRRQTLLDDVRTLSQEKIAKKAEEKAQLEDLTAVKSSIEVKLRHNDLKYTQEHMLAEINQQITRLDISSHDSFSFTYVTNSMNKLEAEISLFGCINSVKATIPTYSNMQLPVVAVGSCWGQEPGQCYEVSSVAFSDVTKQIFITDYAHCIHVFSEEGIFIKKIEEESFSWAYGVAVYKNNMYATDADSSCIYLFTIPDCKLIKTANISDRVNNLFQLTVSSNGSNLYIPSRSNDKIIIMDANLHYINEITHSAIKEPEDFNIHDETLFILCAFTDAAIQVFSLTGDHLYSLISRQQVESCSHFCIDMIGNVIINDMNEHNIKIFNEQGKLIHILGNEGDNKGEFSNPRGVAIINSSKLIVISNNPNFSLQIFK